jgi:hypothetical protein
MHEKGMQYDITAPGEQPFTTETTLAVFEGEQGQLLIADTDTRCIMLP